MSAFEILSYIFVVVGNLDIDDSEGGTGMLGNDIYQLWVEIIEKLHLITSEKCLNGLLLTQMELSLTILRIILSRSSQTLLMKGI